MGTPGRRTLLVVDDEADMLENIVRILERNRYRCLGATSAQAALALLERERPDLILTDLRMPGTDGLTLLRQARRLVPGTPVVILTAFATGAAAREARAAGAAGYLPKPFTARELLLAVGQAIGEANGHGETPSPPVPATG